LIPWTQGEEREGRAGVLVRDSKHEADLSASLERVGQQVPVTVVVGSGPENWILVDGHRRVRALKRLGKDTIQAVVLEMSAPEALFRVRVDLTRRPLDVFEEALLIREVHQGHGIGIEAIADRFGKSQTWVRQRMDLVTVLPDDVQQRVLKGRIPVHSALKVLVVMARSNPGEAQKFAAAIDKARLSTRDIERLHRLCFDQSRTERQRT